MVTYSLSTEPWAMNSCELNFLINSSLSVFGSLRPNLPSGDKKLNMCPLIDVYGIVAPLLSTEGIAAMSASYNFNNAGEMLLFSFLTDI